MENTDKQERLPVSTELMRLRIALSLIRVHAKMGKDEMDFGTIEMIAEAGLSLEPQTPPILIGAVDV